MNGNVHTTPSMGLQDLSSGRGAPRDPQQQLDRGRYTRTHARRTHPHPVSARSPWAVDIQPQGD
eukprot:CAMPEP_0181219636 /NCGR_PEP_ID=MMETSP1096-20121128/28394_1 /TAXON_ID=156174 ORGANISM="Chrysochromulina ericina, Strain CCMP281" /NCGR_SAMPLE_ID=MMETSP1096 /ASSEMBLY_ACC=CAM_ASM_000453 /LENGTH=63 /DNA_ID=CAMNT_0023312055 /DNA_START=250 /DNA_END=441 /DNA_ORIENTATION=-